MYRLPCVGLNEPSVLSLAITGKGPTPRSGDAVVFSGKPVVPVPVITALVSLVRTAALSAPTVRLPVKCRLHDLTYCNGGGFVPLARWSVSTSIQVPLTTAA